MRPRACSTSRFTQKSEYDAKRHRTALTENGSVLWLVHSTRSREVSGLGWGKFVRFTVALQHWAHLACLKAVVPAMAGVEGSDFRLQSVPLTCSSLVIACICQSETRSRATKRTTGGTTQCWRMFHSHPPSTLTPGTNRCNCFPVATWLSSWLTAVQSGLSWQGWEPRATFLTILASKVAMDTVAAKKIRRHRNEILENCQ